MINADELLVYLSCKNRLPGFHSGIIAAGDAFCRASFHLAGITIEVGCFRDARQNDRLLVGWEQPVPAPMRIFRHYCAGGVAQREQSNDR